jgi:hypothetical protein
MFGRDYHGAVKDEYGEVKGDDYRGEGQETRKETADTSLRDRFTVISLEVTGE